MTSLTYIIKVKGSIDVFLGSGESLEIAINNANEFLKTKKELSLKIAVTDGNMSKDNLIQFKPLHRDHVTDGKVFWYCETAQGA